MAHRTDRVTRTAMDKIIEQATQLLVEAAHAAKIILFGSYARGDFTEDSDLDLLVIVPSVEDHIEEMARLRLVLRELPIAIGSCIRVQTWRIEAISGGPCSITRFRRVGCCMTPHDRELELLALAQEDEQSEAYGLEGFCTTFAPERAREAPWCAAACLDCQCKGQIEPRAIQGRGA